MHEWIADARVFFKEREREIYIHERERRERQNGIHEREERE